MKFSAGSRTDGNSLVILSLSNIHGFTVAMPLVDIWKPKTSSLVDRTRRDNWS